MKNLTPLFILMILVFSGCSTESLEDQGQLSNYDAKAKAQANNDNSPTQLGTPEILCGEATAESWPIGIKAGSNGTPGGIKVQWMTEADFIANGNEWDDSACQFNSKTSDYELAQDGEAWIDLAVFIDPSTDMNCAMQWDCNETYVFRVKAENPNGNEYRSSEWSTEYYCTSQPCETICTHGLGYWKNHSNENPGQQLNRWNTDNLDLGSVNYDQSQLNRIMDQKVEGNGLVSLAHHLIAAKLNIANGVDDSSIAQTIIDADAMIGSLEVPPVGSGSLTTSEVETLKDALEAFNTSNPCDDNDTAE
ncbi:hypothetical protein C7S20_11280 [Christiangramia fulva]|uniref:Uncharacterized protein n=1 Tax=Christiangramia fulva TaxID=2126553 RepID=A0A2R3Z696_9FLAO|nr:hypothetical protein [Christiangramia fulva]AVR45785.1 hypothetical protein C7S20_11280 [Christiangramia fulva]